MKLYLSGATEHEGAQPDPKLSFGGFVSSSPLPNGQLNNLFSGISDYTLSQGQREVRSVVLKNETAGTVSGATLYYDMQSVDPITNYKMAVVTLADDGCGGYYLESIDNIYSLPVNATFIDNRGSANAIALPDIAADGYLGIWIMREINQYAAEQAKNCSNMFDVFLADEAVEVFTITTVADSSGSLDGTYFTFDTPNGKFFMWYDNTGSTAMPEVAGREGIRVSIVNDDDADTVASKTQAQIEAILNPRGEVSASVDTNVIAVSNFIAGDVSSPQAGTSGFTIAVTTEGSSAEKEQVEDILLTISY